MGIFSYFQASWILRILFGNDVRELVPSHVSRQASKSYIRGSPAGGNGMAAAGALVAGSCIPGSCTKGGCVAGGCVAGGSSCGGGVEAPLQANIDNNKAVPKSNNRLMVFIVCSSFNQHSRQQEYISNNIIYLFMLPSSRGYFCLLFSRPVV